MVFFVSILIGIVAVFTPYYYAIVPITLSHPVLRSTTIKGDKWNSVLLSIHLVLVITVIGVIASVIDQTTGMERWSTYWLFNLFFFRLFFGLGLSLLGAFEIKFPKKILSATSKISRYNKFYSLFFMALALPALTFSSIGPMIILVLILAAKGNVNGPVIGMFGFSLGLCVPLIYPRLINLLPTSVLNRINVLIGFFSVLISLKFFSRADIAGHWGLMGRNLFLAICILIFVLQGCYMIGWLRLSNDYPGSRNVHGQQYVSLLRLFIAIASFTFVLYLIPGLWGAPLKIFSPFLPPR